MRVVLETPRQCVACDSTTTYVRRSGRVEWCRHDGFWYCRACYRMYVRDPIDAPLRFRFGNIRRSLGIKTRKGKCEWCHKQIGDKYIDYFGEEKTISKTDMHHIEYFIIFPWFGRVELCVPCHSKESWRQRTHLSK